MEKKQVMDSSVVPLVGNQLYWLPMCSGEKKIIEELAGPTVVKKLVGIRIEEPVEEGWEGKAWPVMA